MWFWGAWPWLGAPSHCPQWLPGVPAHPHLPSPCRKGGSGPRRSLSVEDIGAPGRLRAVGRVVEVFPDGTSQLELQRPPQGAFGFCVTSGHGRPDTGMAGLSQSVT